MSYIFRNEDYAGADYNGTKCWSPNIPINVKNFKIEKISSTRGSSKAGTAIPSPLARLELFDTAFEIVATEKMNNLKGESIYHQLVSDCLDLLQLLFDTKNNEIGAGKKIWFKEWKVKENISKLLSKGDAHPHALLGKSFDQIFSDKSTAFHNLDSIFLIYYENKLIGGTSPLTLVFTTPNWNRYVNDGLLNKKPQSLDGDIFFDKDYKALFERDAEFVAYLYKLLLQNNTAFAVATNLKAYINQTVSLKFQGFVNEFKSFHNSSVNAMDIEYDRLLTNINRTQLIVNGISFYVQKEGKEQLKVKSFSDFIIKASVDKYKVIPKSNIEVHPPLVLTQGMNYPGDYIEKNSPWNSFTRIRPQYISVPLQERNLPQGEGQSIKYPFVTTEDFLEKTLIELPFNVNKQYFVSVSDSNFKYLLPIKKEYFNFFSLKDLEDQLKITFDEDKVNVELHIPISNKKGVSYIPFVRTYSKRTGNIKECRFDIGIYPFYKLIDIDPQDYYVLLANAIEKEKNKEEVFLKFFSYETSISVQDDQPNSEIRTVSDVIFTKHYKLSKGFDFIEFTHRPYGENLVYSGLIIPDYKKNNREFTKASLSKEFIYAIDFGTSNTHIAWKEYNDALPKPFEIESNEQQMVLLNEPANSQNLEDRYGSYGSFPQMDLVLRREFLPAVITSKDNAPVAYPFKTATCEILELSSVEKSKVDLFKHVIIGYYIDKEETKGNIQYTTNLKWLLENAADTDNANRVKLFLKQILLQIKTKTILNKGSLEKLDIVWSAPSSMAKGNRTEIQKLLTEAYQEVFGDKLFQQKRQQKDGKFLLPVLESVAPYFFLINSEANIQETADTINVDIGGGTTDVMMFMGSSKSEKDKRLSTSFRFAGNDIWGSGYNGKLKDNGFIKNFEAYQKKENINPNELKFFKKGKDDSNINADDLISLLFTYDKQLRFSSSITIANPDLLLILYIHYSALVYHVIQIVESKEYNMPRYLSFTGKGSQYLRLICGGDERELNNYTKLLFKTYTKKDFQASFRINLSDNPKEITANGAVLFATEKNEQKRKMYEPENDRDFEFKLPGYNPQNNEIAGKLTEELTIADTLQIDSPLNIAVLNNLNEFLEKTLCTKQIIDFLAEFKIMNTKAAYEAMRWNSNILNGEGLVYDSYRKVLNSLKLQNHENVLPESLFFFGLKDALYQLSKLLSTK